MTHELDGTYQVTTTTSLHNAGETQSGGTTEIRGGQTSRYDDNKCKWTSTFEIINNTEVKMTSVADPSESDLSFMLTTPGGEKTRQPVTYEGILKLARKDDKIQMSGRIEYGFDVVLLTMRKTGN